MAELKELIIYDIEEIKELFKDTFMGEPWKDDWSDVTQLHFLYSKKGSQKHESHRLHCGGMVYVACATRHRRRVSPRETNFTT